MRTDEGHQQELEAEEWFLAQDADKAWIAEQEALFSKKDEENFNEIFGEKK